MKIEDFIRHVLSTMPSDGWSQMSMGEIVKLASSLGVGDTLLCADVCIALGIGELTENERTDPVVFEFGRPDIWRAATTYDVGRVARFGDTESEHEPWSYGILKAIESDPTLGCQFVCEANCYVEEDQRFFCCQVESKVGL